MSENHKEIVQGFWDKNQHTSKNPMKCIEGTVKQLHHINMATGISFEALYKLSEKKHDEPENDIEWEYYSKIFNYLATDGAYEITGIEIDGPPD